MMNLTLLDVSECFLNSVVLPCTILTLGSFSLILSMDSLLIFENVCETEALRTSTPTFLALRLRCWLDSGWFAVLSAVDPRTEGT